MTVNSQTPTPNSQGGCRISLEVGGWTLVLVALLAAAACGKPAAEETDVPVLIVAMVPMHHAIPAETFAPENTRPNVSRRVGSRSARSRSSAPA